MPYLLSGWKPSPGEAYCFVDHPAPAMSQTSIASSSVHVKPPAALPRRGEPGHVKRPRNGFIIFRCEFVAKNRGKAPRSKSGGPSKRLSQLAGETWKKLPAAQRDVYMTLAALEKDEHSRQHPDYVYRPNKQRSGRQSTTPKRAYRPASTVLRRQAPAPTPVPVEMPAIGALSLAGPSSEFVPAPSPSYSSVDSAYSPSSSRSTPFLYDAQSPATDSDYPQTPNSEYAMQIYDAPPGDVMNAYTYSYQSAMVTLPMDHHYTENSGLYVASPSPSPSYTYGPPDEPPVGTASSYSTLANWAGELDAASTTSTSSSATYAAPAVTMAPPAEVSGYPHSSFGSEVVDFDAYVYSEPVTFVPHV
ncbi:unnamed protein product [Peniophora sp. CBMAI 1063]|nr:unnamed protein product [Peniophora sp. CBMAI 1063]